MRALNDLMVADRAVDWARKERCYRVEKTQYVNVGATRSKKRRWCRDGIQPDRVCCYFLVSLSDYATEECNLVPDRVDMTVPFLEK